MKVKLLLFISFLIVRTFLFAQSYSIDTTFSPQYDFYNEFSGSCPTVFDISEHYSGSVFVSGDYFDYGDFQSSCVLFYENGEINQDFDNGYGANGAMKYFQAKEDTLCLAGSIFRKFDMYGNVLNWDWELNKFEDFNSFIVQDIHMLEDESMLYVGNFRLVGSPTRYQLIKLKPDGHVDSSLIVNAFVGSSYNVFDIHPYDETRYLVYGNYESWLGQPAKGMSRIFISDGTLDTTFHNIFDWGGVYVHDILPDGRILVAGHFILEGDTTILAIARLKPDGSLDPSFNNFNNVVASYHDGIFQVCPTPDGGYLVGGLFFNYQNHYRGCIAKIDADGFLDTTVLNGLGFDTLTIGDNYSYGVRAIEPAQGGKYYIGGNVKSFNGDSISPIIRIHGNMLNIQELGEINNLNIYPNPAINSITIASDNLYTELHIFSQMGQLLEIIKCMSSSSTIDISGYSPGTYFIRAVCKNYIEVSKFVIVR